MSYKYHFSYEDSYPTTHPNTLMQKGLFSFNKNIRGYLGNVYKAILE